VPEAVTRRRLCDAAGKQRPHDWERAAACRAILQQGLVVVPEIQQVVEGHDIECQEEEAMNVPQQEENVEQLLRSTNSEYPTGKPMPTGAAFVVRIWASLGVLVPFGLWWW
jgi:hypothetical protein